MNSLPNQSVGDSPGSLQSAERVVVPVVREEWQLHKETHDTGTVRVQRLIQNREELIEDSLLSETMDVERIPVNRIVESAPEIRTENGVTIISVVKEFAILTKQLRVVEEIRISRRRSEIPLHQTIELQSEEVTVQRLTPSQAARTGELPPETMEFQETLEQAVVTKHARVVEEVSVTKEVSERTETITDTVRHTEVELETLSPEQIKAAAASGR